MSSQKLFEIPQVTLSGGEKMPGVGFGTWQISPDKVGEVVKNAVKAGFRHIDCAYQYGNQREVGVALKELFDEGVVKREDLFIASKLWNSSHSPQDAIEEFNQTLADLQLEYIDLYMIHWPLSFERSAEPPLFSQMDPKTGQVVLSPIPLIETWRVLETLVDRKLVRNIGISNFLAQTMLDLYNSARIKPVTNQLETHPLCANLELQKLAERLGIHIEAYSPLGSGCSRIFKNPLVVNLAKSYNKDPAQILIRYALQRGMTPIIRSTNPQHMNSNLKVFDFELTQTDMQILNDLDENYRVVNPVDDFGLAPFC